MLNKLRALFLIGLCLWLIFFMYSTFQKQQQKPNTLGASATGHVGDARLYPDSTFTPGDIFPNATADQICQKGYTKTVRNVPVSVKKVVYQEYGFTYPQPRGAVEVDHFIPLELGGSNDLTNLWVEPAAPSPGFHEKDIVENYLHDAVCHGQETLLQAQTEIKTDWYAVYKRIPNPAQFAY